MHHRKKLTFLFLSGFITACTTPSPDWYERPGNSTLKSSSFEDLQNNSLRPISDSYRRRISLTSTEALSQNPELQKLYTGYLQKKQLNGPYEWKTQLITKSSMLPKAPFVLPGYYNNTIIRVFREETPLLSFRPVAYRFDSDKPGVSFHLVLSPDDSPMDLLPDPKHPLILDDGSPPAENLASTLTEFAKKPPADMLLLDGPQDLTYNLGETAPPLLEAWQKLIPANSSRLTYAVWHATEGVRQAGQTSGTALAASGLPEEYTRDLSGLTSCYLQVNFEECLTKFVRYQTHPPVLPPQEQKSANHILMSLFRLYFRDTEARDLRPDFIFKIMEKAEKTLLGPAQNDFQEVMLKILRRNDGPQLMVRFFQESKTFGKLHPEFLKHLQILTLCLAGDLDGLNNIASEEDLYTMTTFLKEHPAVFNRYVKSLNDMGLTPFSEPVMAYFQFYFPDYSQDILKIFSPAARKNIAGLHQQLKTGSIQSLLQRFKSNKGKIPQVQGKGGDSLAEDQLFPAPAPGLRLLIFVNSSDAFSQRTLKKFLGETSPAFQKQVQIADILNSSPDNFETFLAETGLGKSPLLKKFVRIPLHKGTRHFYESLGLYHVPRFMVTDQQNNILDMDTGVPFSFSSTERDLQWLAEAAKSGPSG